LADNFSLPKIDFDTFHKNALLYQFIYKQSIVNQDDYYKTCTLISFKTANNQDIIDKMPFYVFNNFMIYLKDIMEEENNSNGGGNNTADGLKSDASKQLGSTMGKAKAMLPGNMRNSSAFNLPKL
jgi:hypothetical protein